MQDLLSNAICALLDDERFYAELIMQMDRFITTRVPTAGVCIKDKIQLHINPDFFKALSPTERVAILKHECQHILNDHISRMKQELPDVYDNKSNDVADRVIGSMKHMVANISADLSINPGIPGIPKDGVMPEQFNVPGGETMEWYINNLKNNDKIQEITDFDEHSLWANSEGDKEALKEKIRQAVNKAAKNAKSVGKISNDLELLIDRLNYKAKDWKSDLKRFVARTIETTIESTRKRRNRRYGTMYPGNIKVENLHLGVAIDTSGSVSDEALCQFMAEIAVIAKYAKVTVVEADTQIKNMYTFDPKKVYKVAGRGGTAYQPAFDFFNDTEVDGVIYFGDMDCFDTAEIKKPKYPVLWAIIGNQPPPVSWGSKTSVEIKMKGEKE